MKDFNKRNTTRFAIIILFILLGISVTPLFGETGTLETVRADEFFSLLEERQDEGKGIILDVRTAGEVADGTAPGSENIDFYGSEFKNTIDGLDKDETYFIYCRSGSRSGQTLRLMESLGFNEVYDLSGGWSRNASRLLALDDK